METSDTWLLCPITCIDWGTAQQRSTSAALMQPVRWLAVKDTNLNTYKLLRMGNVPEVDIEFLPSSEAPVGLGEPATTAVAPAIASAIFSASGARRHLPIRREDVRQTVTKGALAACRVLCHRRSTQ